MSPSPMHRHPLGPLLLTALALSWGLLIALFLVDAIGYAYHRIGIPEGALFGLVLASLLGGMVNIPVARLRGQAVRGVSEVVVFGVRYRLPVVLRAQPTMVAVNLGGAIIPVGVSIVLLTENAIWWQAAVATGVVTVVVHAAARPVQGLGIAVPGLVPPVVAAMSALLLAPHLAAAVAYVAGALGTLIGADLLNLRRLSTLGAGVASIGGAGTFDGIFMSSILAVVLVAIA